MTVREALHDMAQALKNTSDAPDLDAQRLLLHVLCHHQPLPCIDTSIHETSWLFAHSEVFLDPSQEKLLKKLIQRRADGQPLAYILGAQEFYGRSFVVTPDVLIPRPTTEDLIDQALVLIDQLSQEKKRSLIVADIGTGSGCIGITLLQERSEKIEQVVATDISEKALAVAQKNAAQHKVADKILFLQGSLLEPLMNKNIDLIVSNPPYVPTSELDDMSGPEKRGLAYEPRIALDGGPTGTPFTAPLATADVPVIYETTGGNIDYYNWNKKSPQSSPVD